MLRATLSAVLERSVCTDPWHGFSLRTLLDDLSVEEAVAHPVSGAHSIAEIVMHLASWMDQVNSWLEGRGRTMTDERDWPSVPAWPEPVVTLMAAHGRLIRGLGGFPEARLAQFIGSEREPAAGTGLTFEATVLGVAEHNAYHGGQIALLKRALRPRA